MRLIASMILAAAVFWVGLVIYVFLFNGYSSLAGPIRIGAAGWQIVEGRGEHDSRGLRLQEPGELGLMMAVNVLPSPIAAEKVERLEFELGGNVITVLSEIGWSRSETLGSASYYLVESLTDGKLEVRSSDLVGWRGDVHLFIFRSRGKVGSEIELGEVLVWLETPSLMDFHLELIKGWFAFRPWDQVSINRALGGSEVSLLSPVVMVAIWGFLSGVFFVLISRRPTLQIPGLCVLIFICWAILDVRWQLELFEKLRQTYLEFHEEDDGAWKRIGLNEDQAAIIDLFKERQIQDTKRILVVSDDAFAAQRARYVLAPSPVFVRKQPINRLLSRQLASGDVILSFAGELVRWHSVRDQEHSELTGPVEYSLDLIPGRYAKQIGEQVVLGSTMETESRLLLRSRLELPEGFYNFTVRLQAEDGDGVARIRVVQVGSDGVRELSAERDFWVSDKEWGKFSLPLKITESGDAILSVWVEGGHVMKAKEPSLSLISEPENLGVLLGDGSGPRVVVERIMELGEAAVFEVQ